FERHGVDPNELVRLLCAAQNGESNLSVGKFLDKAAIQRNLHKGRKLRQLCLERLVEVWLIANPRRRCGLIPCKGELVTIGLAVQ
ncbi:MAG: hypothetical protein ACI91G_001312, partial [Gammaproteobacteria bacterium]